MRELHIGRRFLFQIMKAGNHVGNLDAGVINVVLHFDFDGRDCGACGRKCRPRMALRK
jgi:hypothetical protein